MKVLSNDEYDSIRRKLQSFDSSLDKAKLVNEFASNIETDFVLLGCTAVEDKLQDKVPQTIADFIVANIKVWMLTGDKLETAENIAYSCKLIQEDFKKIYLKEKDDIAEKLVHIGREIDEYRGKAKISLIVEGPVVMRINENKDIARRYVEEVFSFCDSVVCCRMSPNGKGDVVSLIKNYKKKITLAIGDGANDVNMIKRAHIGIGLYGKEGMRAVQASDYGLVEFKSLWKLLFVHGRWSYIRISEMIQYFFYKNVIFAFPQFVFCFYNAFSGQTIYDDFYISFYNLIFTSWPLIIRAVLDQDIYYKKWTRSDRTNVFDKKVLEENKLLKQFYPHLYYVGQTNQIFK
jgi:phospholipid-transporting ATPase